MKRVTVYSKKRVFDGFLKLDETELSYERFDGQMSKRLKRLCMERGDSVSAILYNRDTSKALLINQFRYATYEKGPGWLLETVAGMIDDGESPEVAMKREIHEEMGYEIESLQAIATFFVSPGGSTERIFLFFAEVSHETRISGGGGLKSEGEDIQTVELSLDELENLLASQSVQDAKTIVAMQWLLSRRSR